MVTARDFRRLPEGKVVVGEDTRRVCNAAVRKLRSLPDDARIVATAGHTEEYGVVMGAGPMHEYLVRMCGIPAKRVYTPDAKDFDTNGEMTELARVMREV